ncbi:MAG: sigma-54-dependent Fis family transcriptional regulator [Planctomycetes bacterium]|nr:sigma-54-dependent Fis family transcriptional regulator [Planctomycetota bacterium]
MSSDRAGDPVRRALKLGLAGVLSEYKDELGADGPAALRHDLDELLAAGAATAAAAASTAAARAAAEADSSGAPALPLVAPTAAELAAAAALAETADVDTLCAHFPKIVARSPKMLAVFRLILKVAPTDATVVIHGESGTGKEQIARSIHELSSRKHGPYVAENCAAFPESLLESELFGHSKGAFTGADRMRKGRFQMADRGTLFLDEVGDMSSALQKKLLRALQEGEIRPVGASAPIKINVRFLSASNKDLAELVKKGLFREDLFFRLSPIKIVLPPLRERGDDLLLLLDHLSIEAARKSGRPQPPTYAPETLALLRRYRWPGNVRELQNEVQRMVALADPGRPVEPRDLSSEVRAGAGA